ncbi:STAS domain-containing protein [Methylococcus geothermalis]|uniref:Anti-sigma factor antagonist n=1 Tax=Methylococcus geothermalis TaxID=2681310 RepID=A0A858Q8J4_9GAMM|nr:STAS domain-containing protein [Methylococcus geothermalis]QJD30169.1 anti-sigma factor antagonist [Methylococcus geothermalis]
MNLSTEISDGKTVLTLAEQRLDAHNSGELKDFMLKLLEGGSRHLVVDLSQVSFIDSSGLGALLSGQKNATLRSSVFLLVGLQPRVRSMFELTRLHRVFEIYSTLEEALRGE